VVGLADATAGLCVSTSTIAAGSCSAHRAAAGVTAAAAQDGQPAHGTAAARRPSGTSGSSSTQFGSLVAPPGTVLRTFDATGCRLRAGCIPLSADGRSVLVISSSTRHGAWILPAGGVDPGESPATAALRETMEEAGVSGGPSAFLAWLEDGGKRTRTAIYALAVTREHSEYMDAARRGRRWVPLEEARAALADAPAAQRMFDVGIAALRRAPAAAVEGDGGGDAVPLELRQRLAKAAPP
jgi:8-oxo-dGTP pyrophosphatase MutT (NUDIX family)